MPRMETDSTCRVIPVAERKRVNALDSVRAGLTVTIFLCHCSYILPDKINRYIGSLTGFVLEMFFILSGFLAVVSCNEKQLVPTRELKK